MPNLLNILRSHKKKRHSNSASSSSPTKKRKSDGIFRTKKDVGKEESTTAPMIEAVITYSLSEEQEDDANADDDSPVSCDSNITFPDMHQLKGESSVNIDNNNNVFFQKEQSPVDLVITSNDLLLTEEVSVMQPSLASALPLDKVELSRAVVVSTNNAANNDDVVVTKEMASMVSDGLETNNNTVATVDASSDSKDSSSNHQLNDHMVQVAYEHQEMIHQLKQVDEDTKMQIANKDKEIHQLKQTDEDTKMQIVNKDKEIQQLILLGFNAAKIKYAKLLASKDHEIATIKKVLEEIDTKDSNQINHVMQVANKHKEMIHQLKQADDATKIKYVQLLASKDDEIAKIKKILEKVQSTLS